MNTVGFKRFYYNRGFKDTKNLTITERRIGASAVRSTGGSIRQDRIRGSCLSEVGTWQKILQ